VFGRAKLVARSAVYFRKADLAVACAVAVCVASVAGALLVGDGVRASLASLVSDRLGEVDHAVLSPAPFTASLAERLRREEDFDERFEAVRALLHVRGGAAPGDGRAGAGGVQIFGSTEVRPGQAVISQALAREIGVEAGDDVLVRTDRRLAVPGDVPLGIAREYLAALRAEVAEVVAEGTFRGSFSLLATQRPARNLWVSREELASALGLEGRANLLLVAARDGHEGRLGAAALDDLIDSTAAVADLGLRLLESDGVTILESERVFIPGGVENALAPLGGEGVAAYLAETVSDLRSGREAPYVTVAGMSSPPGGELERGEVALNAWAADDLAAKVGDTVRLDYRVRSRDGLLRLQHGDFRLARIVPTERPGADRSLVPEFKGMTDAEAIGEWKPARDLHFRAERIREIDEEYWRLHRATPRVFLGLAEARDLWGTRFGVLTSLRFKGLPPARVEARVRELVDAGDVGLAARAIRGEQLASSIGSTDFGGLFLGFSMFLAVGAALLVMLLMGLAVESRRRQIATLRAVGFRSARVRSVIMAEGLLILVGGALAGAVLSVGYARLMMAGLGSIWRGAVGTTLLELHVDPSDLALGVVAGLLLGFIGLQRGMSNAWAPATARSLGGGGRGRSSRAACVGLLLALPAAAIPALGAVGTIPDAYKPLAFFGSGLCALGFLLSAFRLLLAIPAKRGGRPRRFGLLRMIVGNAARNPSRSMLATALVAFAVLVIVAVRAMASSPDEDRGGGYDLVAEFDSLPYDLASAEGRELLAVGGETWERLEVQAFLSSTGEDVSCRNLYLPGNPRVIAPSGGPGGLSGFEFVASLEPDRPWSVLGRELPDGSIPAVLDVESARWIVKKGLGDALGVVDEKGERRTLRVAGLLRKSIFQGEVIVGERAFRELFPRRSGYGLFLIAGDEEDLQAAAVSVRRDLADFGARVESVRERMASFARIANTYISAFEAMGILGLGLGSLGLLAILARAVAERRGELALLGALGFRRRRIACVIAAEHAFVAAAGLVIGAAGAMLAVAQEFAAREGAPGHVALTLLALVGIVALVTALAGLLGAGLAREVGPASLRAE